MNLEVIWASGSPFSWRVLLTLEVKKLEYRSNLIELLKGENRKHDYLLLNPRGKVPVLRDGDFTLYESFAIMSYLDRKYPQVPIFGETPEMAGEIMKVISQFQSYIGPHIGEMINTAFWKIDISADLGLIRYSKKNLKNEFNQLNTNLKENNWLTGKDISASDIFIYPFIQLLLRSEAKLAMKLPSYESLMADGSYPWITEWLKRFKDIPGYERTYPPHWGDDLEINHFIS